MHKILGEWFSEFTDLRERLGVRSDLGPPFLRQLAAEMEARIRATRRDRPVPRQSDRAYDRNLIVVQLKSQPLQTFSPGKRLRS